MCMHPEKKKFGAVDEERQLDEVADDESLTEISVNVNGPKPDPVYLRR